MGARRSSTHALKNLSPYESVYILFFETPDAEVYPMLSGPEVPWTEASYPAPRLRWALFGP